MTVGLSTRFPAYLANAGGAFARLREFDGPVFATVIGDSIEAGSSGLGSNGANCWWNQAQWLSGGKLRVRRQAGIPGNTSSQIAARFYDEAMSYPADMVFIKAGTNDIGQSVAQSVTLQNMRGMVRAALGRGRLPVVVGIPPRGTTASPDTAPNVAATKALNAAYATQVTADGGVFIDIYTALADGTGNSYQNIYSSDGVHPNDLGAKVIANTVLTALGLKLPLYGVNKGVIGANDLGNPVINPFFETTSAGQPSNWTWYGTTTDKTRTLVQVAGVMGNVERITWGNNATPGNALLEQGSIPVAQFQGKRVAFVGRLTTTGLEASGSNVRARVTWGDTGETNVSQGLTAFDALKVDGSGVFYIEGNVPGGVTIATMQFQFTAAGTTPVTIDLAEVAIVDVGEPRRLTGTRAMKTPRPNRTITTSTTLTLDDDVILVDASAGAVTLTLPPVGLNNYSNSLQPTYGVSLSGGGLNYTVVKIDSSANAVTLQRSGTDTINSGTSISTSTQWGKLEVLATSNGRYIQL